MKIRIDPEFSALIPSVPAGDDGELEREVLADGRIIEPLILWNHQQTLLDGHRRHRLMQKHPKLQAPTPVVLVMETRQEAHDWIIRHQLSKRNVTETQKRDLIGKMYVKRASADTVSARETAEIVGSITGVSSRAVFRNAEFSEALDKVSEATSPEVKAAVLQEEVKAGAASLNALADLPQKQRERAAEHIVNGTVTSVAKAVEKVKPKPKPKPGQPVVDARKFQKVKANVGKLVREMTDLKEHAGGASFHATIRANLNEILSVLDQWQKQALKA